MKKKEIKMSKNSSDQQRQMSSSVVKKKCIENDLCVILSQFHNRVCSCFHLKMKVHPKFIFKINVITNIF